MSGDIYLNLFDAIRQDDLALFSSLVEGNEDVSYGRFPLLSLIFLYEAKRLEKVYKDVLCKVSNFRYIPEYYTITRVFKKKAGRAIRLYNDNVTISPLEMLAILNMDSYLKRHFKDFSNDERILDNIRKIYTLRSQKIILTSSTINIASSPLTNNDVNKINLSIVISAICIVVFLGLYSIIGGTTGLGISVVPTRISSSEQLFFALGSSKDYVITKDIELNDVSSILQFSGTLDGQNHTIFVHSPPKKYFLETNNGVIRNLNIVYDNINVEITSRLSLFAKENNGDIVDVNISCSEIDISCKKVDNIDIYISAIAITNNGCIDNCNVSLSGEINGSGSGECSFGAITGINYGKISSCTFLNGKLSSTDIDLSAICVNNEDGAIIRDCVNNCELIQNNLQDDWSPNLSGISMTNYGTIQGSHNYAKLSVISSIEDSQGIIFVAGICINNYGDIFECLSNGDINVTSQKVNVYAGGIVATHQSNIKEQQAILSTISGCGSNGKINISIDNEDSFIVAGGICGYFVSGKLNNNYSLSTFSTGYSEGKYLVGSGIGSIYVDFYLLSYEMTGELSNNFVIENENLKGVVGGYVLLQNNMLNIVPLSRDFGAVQNGLIIVNTEEELKNKEVYWYE